MQIDLAVPHAVFGPETPRWEAGGGGGKAWLDVVVYQGPEREFRLGEIEQAAVGLAVQIGQDTSSRPAATSVVADGRLTLDWDKLRVSIPVRPDTVSVLRARSGIEDVLPGTTRRRRA